MVSSDWGRRSEFKGLERETAREKRGGARDWQDKERRQSARAVREAGAPDFMVCPLRRETLYSVGICCQSWAQLKPIWGALLSTFQTRLATHTPQRRRSERNSSSLRGLKSATEQERDQHKDQQDKVAEVSLWLHVLSLWRFCFGFLN